MEIIILNVILLIIAFFLLILLSFVWPPDSPWSPWWRTNSKTANAIIELAKIGPKDIVYELGSGDGQFLLTVAKKTGAKCVGIEIDPLRYWVSKSRVRLAKLDNKIMVVRSDFFKVDISDATVVYMYLVPNALKKLRPKFVKELKRGTKLVSLKYELDGLREVGKNIDNRLFLHRIP